jgi:TolA-binding protein
MTENGAFGRRFFEPASQDRAANDVAAQEFFWFFFCKKRTAFLHALVDSVCTDPRHGYIRRRSALGDPMRQYLAAFVVFASLAPFSVADGQQFIQSQEGIALQNEILQLQSQVQALQSNGGGGGGSSLGGSTPAPAPAPDGAPVGGGVVASLLTQVQQLQSQVQDLSGKVDTLQNQVNQQHDQTEKEIGDLNFKVTGGAAATPGAPAAGGQLTPPPGAGQQGAQAAPQVAPPTASAAVPATLHDAQAAYAAHNYTGAETAARAVVAKGGQGSYAAQYLVAESLAAEGKPQDAAIAYDDTYNKSHDGVYAAPSLLGLATALANIHQDQAACSTLSSLNSQFPTPPSGMASRIEALSHRAHCG